MFRVLIGSFMRLPVAEKVLLVPFRLMPKRPNETKLALIAPVDLPPLCTGIATEKTGTGA